MSNHPEVDVGRKLTDAELDRRCTMDDGSDRE